VKPASAFLVGSSPAMRRSRVIISITVRISCCDAATFSWMVLVLFMEIKNWPSASSTTEEMATATKSSIRVKPACFPRI
jgi:hypothetical protein